MKDMDAKLYMFILNLKEEKNKKYNEKGCETNIVYVFEDENDFKSYFTDNGIYDISDKVLDTCKMKTTKKGTIIALKGICDNTIKRHKKEKITPIGKVKELTQSQIDEIHARGKITPAEKVKEWENLDLCAPGDAMGSARCYAFSNCHDCLVDYASKKEEYDSIEDNLKVSNEIDSKKFSLKLENQINES